MTSTRFRPIAPDALLDELTASLPSGTCRVAIDGPPAARPDELAERWVERLRGVRPAVHVAAHLFWRDASLRLEYGREDVESYLSWLDTGALQREVLDPVIAAGHYLPSLRDPRTNRSTRATPVDAAPGTLLVVSGAFLLRHGLPFDRTVHLLLTPAALARRTPEGEQWTLAAFAEDARDTRPAEIADVVVRYDDPRHPAVRCR
ncbi:MAG: uridine kinase [Jatrophihabitans sp.]|uniref:uridine kinase n=1 Tax=Jatrophihabitans sp. TaxID=1932789 RepID=UPI003F80241F